MLALILGAGLVIRIVLVATTEGVVYDLESYRIVAAILRSDPLDVYALANGAEGFPRWPYPPGYFPWLAILAEVGDAGRFRALVRLPAIFADLGIAWLVAFGLGLRGAREPTRLVAAALVALGPSFFAVSGFHGQLDAVAILPAVAAVIVWEHPRVRRRALIAGATIGLGAVLKTVPGVILLALLPSVRSRREALTLVAAAAALPIAALAPFVLADPGAIEDVARYRGAVGLGGLSLVAQPDLPLGWFGVGQVEVSGMVEWLRDHGTKITLVAVLLTTALLVGRRTPAISAAVVLWLVVYVTIPAMFMQYFVWGLPFFLLAGHLRAVAALEALLVAPLAITYIGGATRLQVELLYVVVMLTVWAAFAAALGLTLRGRGARS